MDLALRPSDDALLRAIPELKDALDINIELASPELFRFPAIDPPSFRRAVAAILEER